MIRKATAVWKGTGRDGTGHLTSESGVLAQTPYSFKTRFENEKGTNPEELIAAAHATCLSMALANGLAQAGHTPTRLETDAVATLDQRESGFRIISMRLTVRGQVDGIDEDAFRAAAEEAKAGCPVSNALVGNVEITLDAALA